MTIGGSARRAAEDALALAFPIECGGCGAPDRPVCASCRSSLTGPVLSRRTASAIEVLSAASHSGPPARLVASFKDAGRTGSASVLASALLRALDAGAQQVTLGSGLPVLVVPVPSSPKATRRRGFEPLVLICRTARLPVVHGLRLTRRVQDQTELSAVERRRNVDGSMAALPVVGGREIVLIDDVVTTGATLAEAARAVAAAGGKVLFAATITSTPPPERPRSSAPSDSQGIHP